MTGKPRVLVVDDDERNLRLMEGMLIPLGYEVLLAPDGEDALRQVQKTPPDVILLDIMMPGIDGFEVARRLKNDEKTMGIPIVMVTALNEVEDRVKAIEAGADDFLAKPVERTELRARVCSLIKVKEYNDHMRDYQKKLEEKVSERTSQLREALKKVKEVSLDTIYRLSRAAEYRDEDTGAHILRMSNYASAIARRMGLGEERVEAVLYAAPMHDVGKIGIPDRILLKPGKLEAKEWEIMKQHTTIGGRILKGSRSGFLKMAEVIALTHHERWDGSGYPDNLKGQDIPIEGRIVAVADVFDALISRRPYKEPFSLEKSFQIIEQNRGTHFDSDVGDSFFAIKDEILSIKEQYKDRGKSLLLRLSEEVDMTV